MQIPWKIDKFFKIINKKSEKKILFYILEKYELFLG